MKNQTDHGTEPDARRSLPSVSALLDTAPVRGLLAAHPRCLVVDAVRRALDACRTRMGDTAVSPGLPELADRVVACFEDGRRERTRPVINGTGIILHTGLGRAVLPKPAVEALARLDGCCNLQIDLETGRRGKRHYLAEQLLCQLTGAEAALVVNNNAAATMLVLASLCAGREVICSRGQLIEIGGSYRLPDCVHQSGAILVEVGTTNKTHLRDYAQAISENTAALLHVNPSNYRIVGFSASVPIAELVGLKGDRPILVIDDLGCGALVNLEEYGLPHEPTVQQSLAAGADLVCFSGDKLIGGPQSGIIVGRKALIERIRKHPLTRMLRVGKLTDVALEHTLYLFLEPESLRERHPTFRMLCLPLDRVQARAEALCAALTALGGPLECAVEACASAMGGGALPAVGIPSAAVCAAVQGMSAEELARRLRRNEPPIISPIRDGRVVLDLRTVLDGEESAVVAAFQHIAESAREPR